MDFKFGKKNVNSNQKVSSEAVISESQPVKWRKQKKDNKKKKRLSKVIVILIIIVFVASCIGGYFWWKNQNSAEQKKAPATTAQANAKNAEDANLAKIPEQQRVNIEGSIALKNHAFLEQYMAEKVQIIGVDPKASSENTPVQAVDAIKYIDGASTVWSFNLSSDALADYKKGDYASYFKSNAVIGKSDNNYYIIFNFNANGKINSILMSTTAKGMSK